MSQRHSLSLTSHFSSRFSQYLFFLQVTNDQQLVSLIFSFLTIPQLLEFASTSSHFRQLLNIQDTQLRILRAKLKFYEQPKKLSTDGLTSPFSFILPPKPIVMEKGYKSHAELKQFNRRIRFSNYLKKEGIVVNQQSSNEMYEKKSLEEFSNLDKIQRQDGDKFLPQVSKGQWTKAVESELTSLKKSFDDLQQQSKKQAKNSIVSAKKEENPYIKKLEEIERKMARQEFQKRKMQRRQERQNESTILSLEQIKKLADRDPKSRQILNRIYQEEKAKWQRQNAAKLTMKPPPKVTDALLKKVAETQVEKPIPKQTIPQKVYNGLKRLLWSSYQ